MDWEEQILKKQMYFKKTLSDNAISLNTIRTIDVAPLWATNIWLNVTSLDTSVIGLGLLNAITPAELQPLTIDFNAVLPSIDEMMQGIWVTFQAVDFSKIYAFMTDLNAYVIANFKEQFQPEVILKMFPKAKYGITPFGRGFYDPPAGREFLRSTFHRLRLLRPIDQSYIATMDNVSKQVGITDAAKDQVFDRQFLIASAQVNAFVLGLSLLGVSRLTQTQDGWGVIPTKTSDGRIVDIKFKTLDHLQMGFILGVTPLGYGYLLPEESIYKLPNEKENPPILDAVTRKARKISRSVGLTGIAYANYNKPDEMTDYHKSERTAQYDQLMTDREFIESWVEARIPSNEANPVKIRQYKNAVLQLISWREKRHAWGYDGWKAMTEEQFKGWWLENWKQQGLNETTLLNLYEGVIKWIPMLRQRKRDIGEKVREVRRRLALIQQAV
jgi:hypothetical protein